MQSQEKLRQSHVLLTDMRHKFPVIDGSFQGFNYFFRLLYETFYQVVTHKISLYLRFGYGITCVTRSLGGKSRLCQDRSVDWSIGRSLRPAARLVSVPRSVGWFVGWSIAWSLGLSVGWLVLPLL